MSTRFLLIEIMYMCVYIHVWSKLKIKDIIIKKYIYWIAQDQKSQSKFNFYLIIEISNLF